MVKTTLPCIEMPDGGVLVGTGPSVLHFNVREGARVVETTRLC